MAKKSSASNRVLGSGSVRRIVRSGSSSNPLGDLVEESEEVDGGSDVNVGKAAAGSEPVLKPPPCVIALDIAHVQPCA